MISINITFLLGFLILGGAVGAGFAFGYVFNHIGWGGWLFFATAMFLLVLGAAVMASV